jgi:hypothetical protein
LGSVVQENGSSDLEIEKKKHSETRVISMLNSVVWNRSILQATEFLLYKSVVKSILSYEAETWSKKRK